jgi:hypothetical protein
LAKTVREKRWDFQDRLLARRNSGALVPEEGGDPVTPKEVYADGVVTKLPRWQAWARDIKEKLDAMLDQQAGVG